LYHGRQGKKGMVTGKKGKKRTGTNGEGEKWRRGIKKERKSIETRKWER